MKNLFGDILNYIKRLAASLAVISGAAYGISKVLGYRLNIVFFYCGLVCFIIGCGAVVGKNNNIESYQAQSVSPRTYLEVSRDRLNLSSNFKFLIFMALTGLILMVISRILEG